MTKLATAMPLARKVRVGRLFDSFAAPAWMEGMLRRIVESSSAEIAVVVRDGSPRQAREPAWKRLYGYRHHLLYLAYRELDRRMFRVEPDAFAPCDLGSVLSGVPILDVIPRRTRFSDRFSEADLATIRGYDLDVLVRLGFRVIRGGILSAARCGVWSFHHGDPDLFRGGPAGAWEVFLGSSTTGSVLQVHSEELDGGLRRGPLAEPLLLRSGGRHGSIAPRVPTIEFVKSGSLP